MTKLIVLAAAVAGLMVAAPAQAKVVKVIHEGMVEFGSGEAQLFGAENSSLVGMHVLSIYEFDLNRGDRFDGPSSAYVEGGANFGFPGPLLSSSIRINGVTLNLDGALASRYAASDQLQIYSLTSWSAGETIAHTNSALIDFQGLDYEYFGGFGGSGRLLYAGGPSDADIQWATMAYTVTEVPSAIPEPGVWAMMVLGFGLAGGVLRRARPSRSAALPA